jgi:hypothetical protein
MGARMDRQCGGRPVATRRSQALTGTISRAGIVARSFGPAGSEADISGRAKMRRGWECTEHRPIMSEWLEPGPSRWELR